MGVSGGRRALDGWGGYLFLGSEQICTQELINGLLATGAFASGLFVVASPAPSSLGYNLPMSVKESLDKISFFDVTPDLSRLTENERKALRHCIRASEIITDLYLTQVGSKNLELRAELAKRTDQEGKDILKYFDVHGAPWDAFNEEKPFVDGVGSKPKSGPYYPAALTEEEWKNWLAQHPADRESFESRTTVIKKERDALIVIPYSEEYKKFLEEAAGELRAAAELLPVGNLKKFLELRAAAFLSNDYWDSDIAWIDTDGNPFEVTIGPYEVYSDGLFGIKAMFEAFIALPDRATSSELQKFSAALPEFDAILAERWGYNTKGKATPLEVVWDVYRGGEARFGRQFSAYNLPNDRKIHEIKGSKKVFSRTMMEASFKTLGQPISQRILRPEMQKYYQFRNRLLFVLGHELAHGIGPGVREVDGRQISFEILLKDLHSMFEEAKADMLGIALLDHFHKKGLVTTDELLGAVVSEVAAFAPGWRASYTEAHSAGALIEYNWLVHHGAVSYNIHDGVFDIDPEKALAAMIGLSEEFFKIQLEGDYEKATAFVKQWGFIAPEVPGIVERLKDLPITVHPVFHNGEF